MSALSIRPHKNNFGAAVYGLNLSETLTEDTIEEVRENWLKYQILYFPDQPLTHPQLERFTGYLGDWGNDPYIKSIDSHEHILEIRREPDEAVAPFGGSWHSDWSFQNQPPSATILHSKIIPPVGGDTHYADGIRAYELLSDDLKTRIEPLIGLHSARRPYSHEGYKATGGDKRSMTILPNDDAWNVEEHPIVRTHGESGRKALWVNPVYTIGIKDMDDDEAQELLKTLNAHALQQEFVYQHKWAPDMLIMWDNRSVQHCATGGYDGHRRVMHRTTVAGERPS